MSLKKITPNVTYQLHFNQSLLTYFHTGNVCFGRAVGIADENVIPDNQISASSWHDSDYLPHYGRLHGNRGKGWCAKSNSTNMDWLMIDLGKTFEICGVATQGSVHSWATDFMLTYSVDGNNWNAYLDSSGAIMVSFKLFNFKWCLST